MSHRSLTAVHSRGQPTKLVMSWDYLDHACNDIIDQILISGLMPKRVVGLTRGGLPPAVIISHKLEVPMSALDWQTRDGTVQERLKLESILEDLEDGDRLIIVDDIADSGRTFAQIKAAIPAAHQSKVLFAAVVYKTSSVVEPDFYSTYHKVRGEEDVWFVFPYESPYTPISSLLKDN